MSSSPPEKGWQCYYPHGALNNKEKDIKNKLSLDVFDTFGLCNAEVTLLSIFAQVTNRNK